MRLRAALLWLAVPLLLASNPDTAAAQALPAAGDPDAAARAAIQACAARIDKVAVGLAELERVCPALSAALQAAGLRALIIDSSRSRLDRDSLRQLPNLIRSAQGPAPNSAALGPILHGLHPPPTVSRSWWVRFLEWLGEHLAPGQNAHNPAWLTQIQRLLAVQWLWTAIIWITGLALLILVAVIVALEVRAMGRQSIDDPVAAGEAAAAGRLESQLALLRQLPLGERPARLFALLIGRLVASGRLPPDRSLTHREVARRARLEDPQQQQLINQLARISERQLYSGSGATPAGLDELLARGEDLYTTGWGRPVEP